MRVSQWWLELAFPVLGMAQWVGRWWCNVTSDALEEQRNLQWCASSEGRVKLTLYRGAHCVS